VCHGRAGRERTPTLRGGAYSTGHNRRRIKALPLAESSRGGDRGARPQAAKEGPAVPSETYSAFIQRVKEVHAARSVEGVLEWDQETYMPAKGIETRAGQLAFIAGVAHDLLTRKDFGRLLKKVERENDADPIVAANVREMRRQYDRAVKIPTSLMQEIVRTASLAREAWVKARSESAFELMAPHLERLIELKRQVAEKVGYQAEPYDALLDEFEPGARAADVQKVFDDLKRELVPLVQAITDAPQQPNTSVLKRQCPREAQTEFGRRVAAAMGFDFEAGRLDTTAHPFCSGFSPLDVRITTRYDEHNLPMSLFGILHEAGHGLYEQGLDPEHADTPMGTAASFGIHESQSRMWENFVGRSRAFWTYYFGPLQAAFPALADVSADDWHFAVNAVRPSFIRVEADEVTYNLHIMLRFELERRMIAGQLAVKDVPAAWNEGMRELLGITPPNDAQGCLQDIHWSMGIFGYFPTYALGNLCAAQFYAAASRAMPNLENQIARGEFQPLRQWLRESIHRHGRRYRAAELVQVVTGEPLSPQPFVQYLTRKFQPLYGF
jgi:carboxypeptidase Taq